MITTVIVIARCATTYLAVHYLLLICYAVYEGVKVPPEGSTREHGVIPNLHP